MSTFSDEHIERCAATYAARPSIGAAGYTFAAFVRRPQAILEEVRAKRVAEADVAVKRAVLRRKVAQRHVRQRLDAEMLNLVGRVSDGRVVEKMWRQRGDKPTSHIRRLVA